MRETPLTFPCQGDRLCGMLHSPGAPVGDIGVLIVVGGPQYRVGSHRQFVQLARHLASNGIPVLRFDYRGMGDASGEFTGYLGISEDIEAAIDTFVSCGEAGVDRVVLWGLCDAASAITLYARNDPRVCGMVLANPWARTPASEARARIRHYYLHRLFTREFWRKLAGLELELGRSLRDLLGTLRRFGSRRREAAGEGGGQAPLPDRMLSGLRGFSGAVLIVLSGRDLSAREFEDLLTGDPGWRRWAASRGPQIRRLPDADHTFSKGAWKAEVNEITQDFCLRLLS